jgi:hypothetical protein
VARGRSRRLARLSDAPSEPPESEGTRAARGVALGCGLTSLGVVLVAGLLGLVVLGMIRFGGSGSRARDRDGDEVGTAEDPSGLPVPTHGPGSDPGADPSLPSTRLDPLAEMRRRYVPGPHVRVEGMIPSDRAYRAQGTVSPWQSARSADTPWLVLGATYQRDAAPPASPVAAPTILHAPGEPVQRPIDLIPQVPVVARVAAADGTGGPDVMHYLVSFEGYPGHFSLPVRVQTELGPVAAGGSEGAAVRFTIGSAQRPDRSFLARGQTYLATMRIQAVDSAGRVSAPVTRQVNVLPLGQGDVEVAMTMSLATDLDLYVTDPAGATVYYGNTGGFSGGQLDLDANAACSGNMGVQAEHIFWPDGAAPAGNYSVRVAHFESCVGGRPVDYRVTVRACGETVVLTGRFTGMGRGTACTGRAGDPSWCQEVVTFQLPSCRVSN